MEDAAQTKAPPRVRGGPGEKGSAPAWDAPPHRGDGTALMARAGENRAEPPDTQALGEGSEASIPGGGERRPGPEEGGAERGEGGSRARGGDGAGAAAGGAGGQPASAVPAPRKSEVLGRQEQEAEQRGGEPGRERGAARVRGRLAGRARARLLPALVLAPVAAPVVVLGGRVPARAPPRVFGGQVSVEGGGVGGRRAGLGHAVQVVGGAVAAAAGAAAGPRGRRGRAGLEVGLAERAQVPALALRGAGARHVGAGHARALEPGPERPRAAVARPGVGVEPQELERRQVGQRLAGQRGQAVVEQVEDGEAAEAAEGRAVHALQPVPVQQQPVQAAQAAEHVLRQQPQAVPVQEEVAQVGQVREQVILAGGEEKREVLRPVETPLLPPTPITQGLEVGEHRGIQCGFFRSESWV